MTRTSVRSPSFVCAGCGYESAKWLGRCTECGTWGSVVESERPTARSSSGRRAPVGSRNVPVPIAQVAAAGASLLPTDLTELDRVPGGGGVAGSVTQVRDGAQELVRLAKECDIATLLVGHVTKDGGLAGPRALEHVVDTVLSFEGDRHHGLRMLRALKHRFGATDELGLME